MFPNSRKTPPTPPPLQNKTKTKTPESLYKNAFTSFRCLLFSAIIFLIFIVTRTPAPLSLPTPHSLPSSNSATSKYLDECESGRIYVYDLPKKFNRQLLTVDCDDLDPWRWECGIATNNGYGRRATELATIMPESLSPAWYRTNQFSLEVIYHYRILNHKCRAMEPESATAFYIPFYAGLAVGKYLFGNHTEEERDYLCGKMLTWLQDQPYWKRCNGSDHFMALGRITWDFRRLTDPERLWGSSFLNMPLIQTTTRLTIERAPFDYYDIGVPYPTGFHPHNHSQLTQWQHFVRTRNRTHLTSFVGATRDDVQHDFRGVLLSQCKTESESCRLVDCAVTQCANGSSATLEALLDSDFCLQPKGDSYTRRSVFDCMIAGSIPVFFWKRTAYDQYEWFLPEMATISVFIDHNDVSNGTTSIWEVLAGYNKEKVRKMREKVIEYIPKIVYAMPGEGLKSERDAFDLAVDGVLWRFKEERDRQGIDSAEPLI